MGRRKKTDPAPEVVAAPTAATIEFVDGPRAGRSLRVSLPLRRYMRFATPEWCTYERVDGTDEYRYVGDVKLEYSDLFGSGTVNLDV